MTDALAAAILGGIILTIVTVFSGAWVLSGRMSAVESKVDSIPERIDGAVLRHQIHCPATSATGGAVAPQPGN